MALRVLGSLDIDSEGISPRERTILAALVVRRGGLVSPSELAEAWWGESPPQTWSQQVRNSVARIRTRLGRDAIETVGADYRLGLDLESIDAVRFERLISDARAHALRGAHDQAADAYRRALRLWRGEPLAELASWPPGASEALRLGEIRASAEEELLEERLRAGDHRAVIPDAERLVREDPLREDRWAILALANYRSERQAEALAVLRAARQRLDDELGIEPGARLTDLETAILRHDPDLATPPSTQAVRTDCPYRGLAAFGPEDADEFFGRDSDIDAVIERIRPGAAITVAGPSGSGKSSLLLAGVAPRLRASGREVSVLLPNRGGLEALQIAIERDAVGPIVCVDQAEELFGESPSDIDEMTGILERWLARGGALMISIRSDFLDRATALPRIGSALGRNVYALAPLAAGGLRDAIERPAQSVGLQLEPGLVEVLLRDAGDRPGILPALSHALVATWARRAGATLTVEGYEESGGIAGAIAQSAEGLFQRLSAADQVVCRSLMMRFLERSPDGVTVRRRVPLESLMTDVARRRVVEDLVAARLVSVDGDTALLAHEAVATAWPRLDEWLTEDAADTRMLRRLEASTIAWDEAGRGEDDLLRGAGLHTTLEWRESSRPDLTEAENEFLDASAHHADAERRELSERAARDRQQNRQLRWALRGAAGLLVFALAAGAIAAVQGVQAGAASENARIEAVVATSLSLQSSDRDVAALLAAAAYRHWPEDGRVRSSLWGAMNAANGLVRKWTFDDGARVAAAAVAETDTALLVTDLGDRSTISIVDLETGAHVREVDVELPTRQDNNDRIVAISPDGSTAVVQTPLPIVVGDDSQCCVNNLTFIDLATDTVLPGSGTAEVRTTSVMLFEPGNSGLLIGNSVTGDLMRVDVQTGELTASSADALTDHSGEEGTVEAIAEAGPGRVAIGSADAVTLYELDSLSAVAQFPVEPGRVGSAIAADAETIITAGPDGLASIDIDTGASRWSVDAPRGGTCWNLALDAPRGVAYCGQLGAVATLSLATGGGSDNPRATQTDDAPVLTLRRGGSELLAAGRSSIFQWRVDGSGPVTRLVANGRDLAGGFGADGRTVVTADRDGSRMQLWDLDTDAAVGDADEAIVWISGDDVVRWDADVGTYGPSDGGSTYELAADVAATVGSIWDVAKGRPGETAFLVGEGGLVPFDPRTGEHAGPALQPNGDGPYGFISVSESVDATVAAVTWWNPDESRTLTTVFDRTTGQPISEGLYGSEGSLITADADLLAVRDTSLARYDLKTLEPISALPKPFGGGHVMELDDAEHTLLVVGWDNRASLYDFAAGIRLGDPIDTVAPELAGGAHLSADGERLVTGSEEGVLVRDLDPAAQAEAACRIAGRELTPTEWTTYFGDEPQADTCADALG